MFVDEIMGSPEWWDAALEQMEEKTGWNRSSQVVLLRNSKRFRLRDLIFAVFLRFPPLEEAPSKFFCGEKILLNEQ